MRKFLAGAGAMVMTAMLATACGDAPKTDSSAKALAPADAPATKGTTGTSEAKPAEPGSPAEGTPADVPAPKGIDGGTHGTNGTGGTSGTGSAPSARYREVTIPAGTTLSVRLRTGIGSDTSRPEQRIDGTLTRDVSIGGVEALAAGSSLRGIVTNAERSGRVKGRANVAFKFDHISANGTVYPISTRTIAREAPATKKRDAATIGIPAAGGAIIGGIIGGGDAALKGGAIGGAAGTAAVLSTRGKEVRLAPGTTVTVRLASPLTVRVPVQ